MTEDRVMPKIVADTLQALGVELPPGVVVAPPAREDRVFTDRDLQIVEDERQIERQRRLAGKRRRGARYRERDRERDREAARRAAERRVVNAQLQARRDHDIERPSVYLRFRGVCRVIVPFQRLRGIVP